jgi:hypothetical protein
MHSKPLDNERMINHINQSLPRQRDRLVPGRTRFAEEGLINLGENYVRVLVEVIFKKKMNDALSQMLKTSF